MSNEDKEKDWEQRKNDINEERDIRKAFTTDIGHDADKFLAILSGSYKAPRLATDSDRIFAKSETQKTTRGVDLSKFSSLYENLPDEEDKPDYQPPTETNERHVERSSQNNKYAEFTEQLDRFPFLRDSSRRKEVAATVVGAIRTALNDLIIKEVASNTKKAFTEHCKKVFKTQGGIKVIFNFGGNDIEVTAKGSFYGDETVCIHNKNGKTVPAVIKVVEAGYIELTSQFEMTIG